MFDTEISITGRKCIFIPDTSEHQSEFEDTEDEQKERHSAEVGVL